MQFYFWSRITSLYYKNQLYILLRLKNTILLVDQDIKWLGNITCICIFTLANITSYVSLDRNSCRWAILAIESPTIPSHWPFKVWTMSNQIFETNSPSDVFFPPENILSLVVQMWYIQWYYSVSPILHKTRIFEIRIKWTWPTYVCMYIYIYMHVCIYVCMYVYSIHSVKCTLWT